MRTTLIILASFSLLSIASAGAASATPAIAVASSPDDDSPSRWRLETDIGMLIGSTDIGDVEGSAVGVHLNLGVRLGSLALLGEYDYQGVGEPDWMERARRGSLTRIGAVARYSLLTIGDQRSPIATDWWVEAGAGRQRVAWDGGGLLTRTDLALGFGMQLDGRLDRDSRRPKHVGPYVAFRAHVARAPGQGRDPQPTCGGPCNQATAPSKNDVSLFLHFGMSFGR
jgi:hypothetical protein